MSCIPHAGHITTRARAGPGAHHSKDKFSGADVFIQCSVGGMWRVGAANRDLTTLLAQVMDCALMTCLRMGVASVSRGAHIGGLCFAPGESRENVKAHLREVEGGRYVADPRRSSDAPTRRFSGQLYAYTHRHFASMQRVRPKPHARHRIQIPGLDNGNVYEKIRQPEMLQSTSAEPPILALFAPSTQENAAAAGE